MEIVPRRQHWKVFVLLLGIGVLLGTATTLTGHCAPVGGYDEPAGVHYLIMETSVVGVAYGNGCQMTISAIGLGLGVLLVGVGNWITWR